MKTYFYLRVFDFEIKPHGNVKIYNLYFENEVLHPDISFVEGFLG